MGVRIEIPVITETGRLGVSLDHIACGQERREIRRVLYEAKAPHQRQDGRCEKDCTKSGCTLHHAGAIGKPSKRYKAELIRRIFRNQPSIKSFCLELMLLTQVYTPTPVHTQ